MLDVFFSFAGLVLLVVVAWIVARFVFRLTARVIGCLLTGIIAIGIVAIILIFFI